MNSRRLGASDLTLSEIGLGCQSLGGGMFHGSRREALTLVKRALDAGVTYFDTADHYSLGRSEEMLGEALQPVRERVVISTKLGTLYTPTARLLLASRPAIRAFGRWLQPMKHRLDYYRPAPCSQALKEKLRVSCDKASWHHFAWETIEIKLAPMPLQKGRVV